MSQFPTERDHLNSGVERLRTVTLILILAVLPILNTVAALAQGVNNSTQYSVSSPSEVKQKLHEILSRPEFLERPHQDSEFEKMLRGYAGRIEATWRQFSSWLDRWYERIRSILSPGGGAIVASSTFFVVMFIAICIVTILYLLIKYIAEIRASRRIANKNRANTQSWTECELAVALSRTVEEWLAEAKSQAAEGNYRAAIRARFLGMLVRLDTSGLLDYVRTETNGDHLKRLRSIGAGHAENANDIIVAFRRLIREFDFLWYGENDAVRSDDERSINDFEFISAEISKIQQSTSAEGHALAARR